ncbi:hypothetical protein C0R09_18255 [Brevibacillus laterosporus]|uniref:hypothetical protein n=1 Tax=Brevibacillus laterosporus TaxID=1465 RepID=UPI000C7621D9|nr:hypothetical protein [Brevibacillus laterosporus]AUM66302.1 hypothetical protein C0R09_18255 [Brevibacillus laterosporus]
MIPFVSINEVLSLWASNPLPIDGFTVTNVINAVHLDRKYYKEVLDYLLRKDGFELIAKRMFLCPENHKGETFLLDEVIDEDEIYECHICGADYKCDNNNAIIVFSFTDEFREQMIGSKKKSRYEFSLC